MASNIKGPGIYPAQFGAEEAPFDSWDSITKWAVPTASRASSCRHWTVS
jgi:hypothetical protein